MAGGRDAATKLPARLTLPSGRVVTLRVVSAPEPRGRRDSRAPFSAALALFDEGHLELRDGPTAAGTPVAVDDLSLGDFHLLRGLALRAGIVPEDEVSITCRNCEAEIRLHPCANLEPAPWVDGELGDEELDTTLPFGEPLDVADVPLGRVRVAKTITLAERAVAEARPLFRALERGPLDVDADLVRALGIVALGPERDPARIAEALATCDDDAFASVTDAFLGAHYVPRLGAVVFCEACGARNDVDVPYERELLPGGAPALRDGARPAPRDFPDLDTFAARARAIAKEPMGEVPGEPVELVVEGGTPAVDDGGEPLLGSYVPPHGGDMTSPSRPPTVTVYYRTFLAMWREDGPYDWEDELTETVEHELEHHVYFLRGEDPMDDAERAEIREEGLRLVGRREANRRALGGFGSSLVDFTKRTWPLFVILALAFVATWLTRE